jgi:hypothetical protein
MTKFSGAFTLQAQMQNASAGTWSRAPGAPTIGTASVISGTSASVSFTPPTDLGIGTVTYIATSNPGSIVGTSSSSPITVSGLTTNSTYTFTVTASTPGGAGPASAASNSITMVVQGQQAYTTPGTYSWVAPAGVTSVSVVAIGGAQGGGSTGPNQQPICAVSGAGAGLGYKNNYSVTPGTSYTVVVGAGGSGSCATSGGSNGGSSYFVSSAVVQGAGSNNGNAGGFTGDGGGTGGAQRNGGAGGAGGGGGSVVNYRRFNCAGQCLAQYSAIGGGGGTGILGEGSNGASKTGSSSTNSGSCTGGNGGSGGGNGANGSAYSIPAGTNTGTGGLYGGGGGAASGRYRLCCGNWGRTNCRGTGSAGGGGAVRIIWPGSTRSFPSTNTGNL